jgi:flagellar FliL protein
MTTPSVVRAARGTSNAKIDGSGDGGEPTKGKKGKKKGGEGGAKKSKKKLIIIIVAVLVVALVGYKMFMPKKAVKPGPPVPGAVVAIDPMTLNLQGGRFLKVGVSLQEIKTPKDKVLETSKATNIMVETLSNMTMASLATKAGKDSVKANLLKQMEAAYPGDLMGIDWTSFVMQ